MSYEFEARLGKDSGGDMSTSSARDVLAVHERVRARRLCARETSGLDRANPCASRALHLF